MLLPFTRVTKKSPKKRTNLKPPVLKIISEKPAYWGARCEYGRVAITTDDKLVRITVARGKKSLAYHITCKYDKHGNFRVYYSCSKGVQDITYKYPYTCNSYLHALFTKITNTRTNKLLPTITKEYFSRFVEKFGSGGLTYENIMSRHPSSYAGNISQFVWDLIYPLNVVRDKLIYVHQLDDTIKGRSQSNKKIRNKKVKGVINRRVPKFIARASRAHDPKEFTKRLFGRAPKSLVKAVILHLPLSEKTINILFMAKVFYGLWTIDKVVEFLKAASDYDCNKFFNTYNWARDIDERASASIITWRSFFRRFTANRIINWYHKYQKEFGMYVYDMMPQLSEFKRRDISFTIPRKKMDIKQIHDVVSKHYNRLSHEKVALPVYKCLHKLNNQKLDNYTIVIPRTNYDLMDWGKSMGICVGSYGNRVIDGSSIIFTLQEKNVPQYCIEFAHRNNGFRLSQCNGRFNKQSSDEIRDKMKKVVESAFNSDMFDDDREELIYPESHKKEIVEATTHIDLENDLQGEIVPRPVMARMGVQPIAGYQPVLNEEEDEDWDEEDEDLDEEQPVPAAAHTEIDEDF